MFKQALTASLFASCMAAAPAAAKAAAEVVVPQAMGDVGKATLWIAFFGLFLPTIYFYNDTFKQPEGKRYFHVLTMSITAIASLAYLVMATGNGVTTIDGGRPFLYARYIDWTLTTPLMLLDLCGLAGASFDTTLLLVVCDVLMIVAGVIGALVGGSNKYLFFIFGMVAFMPIVYFLGVTLKSKAQETGAAAAKIFNSASLLTVIGWSAYPVVWVLAEGQGYLTVDQECVVYTILDIIAKSVFGFMIVNARDGIDEALKATSGTPLADTEMARK